MKRNLIALLVFLAACASPGTPPAPDHIEVQFTSSTQAWLPDLYSCATEAGIAITTETRTADLLDPSVQLSLRLGEPDGVSSPAYEIGMEEIVAIAHAGNPIQSLALSDLRAVFSGGIQNWAELGGNDMPVQVWMFGLSEDISQVFNSIVMQHQPISTQARLAVSVESMAVGVGSDPGAIGYLPRSLVNNGVRTISLTGISLEPIPVLILVSPNAGQAAISLISCAQNK